MKMLRPALVLTATLLVICCVLYPAVVTAAAMALFPERAKGSLLEREGKVVGSSLIGQTLDKPAEHPEYLWGRPSAASVDPATGVLVSGGSNYGPLNAALETDVTDRMTLLGADGAVTGPVPVDLVTKSASGVDPHVSPEAAEIQVERVARARRAPAEAVRAVVRAHTEGATFGLLGSARVNVLEVNLALDERFPKAPGREPAPRSPAPPPAP